MKTIHSLGLFAILFGIALPAFASGPPAAQPVVTWEVWGFKLIDGQWVKQDDHCLKTTDLKQAADYYNGIFRLPNWYATTNAPGCAPPAAPANDRSAADASFADALDGAGSPFHGPLGYSPDVNDPVNGYKTLHPPGVSNGYVYGYNSGHYDNGYYGYNSRMGYYREYHAGPNGGIRIRVKAR
jgi:hypothetical protein